MSELTSHRLHHSWNKISNAVLRFYYPLISARWSQSFLKATRCCFLALALFQMGSTFRASSQTVAPATDSGELAQDVEPAASIGIAEGNRKINNENSNNEALEIEGEEASPSEALPPKPEFVSAGFSGLDKPRRAKWQQKLTLGPGDEVNLRLYGYPTLERPGVAIGPDGRISYLQIQDFIAAGLTIDELREALSAELSVYYRNALVIVTPGSFKSKRYVILGKVIDKGVFVLDRPTTVLEAVARARGLETGLFEGNTVELADMSRSFLARGKQRVAVDFENLFYRGDLSQNALLEPGDFLYFPSSIANEVYVLGQVASPGPLGFTQNATVLTMITTRGGFTNRAFRKRVLVVRGSLSDPKTLIVNVDDILAGRAADFPVQPKDIIFIAERPWIRVEELLDMAVSAYIQAATATWTGQNIGPFIPQPFVPSIR